MESLVEISPKLDGKNGKPTGIWIPLMYYTSWPMKQLYIISSLSQSHNAPHVFKWQWVWQIGASVYVRTAIVKLHESEWCCVYMCVTCMSESKYFLSECWQKKVLAVVQPDVNHMSVCKCAYCQNVLFCRIHTELFKEDNNCTSSVLVTC